MFPARGGLRISVGASRNRRAGGPKHRPKETAVLFIGTPEKGVQYFGNSHILAEGSRD